MKPISNFSAKESRGFERLPVGGYICVILAAEVESFTTKEGNTVEKLKISFDIIDGQYINYYAEQYKANTAEDRKWKGVMRIAIPDETSEYAASQKKAFENFAWALQESNPNYTWDWNEKGLKGKALGIIFRDKEWEYNGKTGWFTEPFRITSVDKIREGDFKIPEPKALAKNAAAAAGPADEVVPLPTDDDIPF